MTAKIELHENTIMAVVTRFDVMETAIAKIIQHVQHQNLFNMSVKT